MIRYMMTCFGVYYSNKIISHNIYCKLDLQSKFQTCWTEPNLDQLLAVDATYRIEEEFT